MLLIAEESSHVSNDIEDDGFECTFNKCIRQISLLRKFHLNIATRYLSATTLGTGTSTFRQLLKACIEDTDKSTIKSNKK
jgi:hypothetical protein